MDVEQFIKLSKEGEGTRLEYKTCTEQISNLCMKRYAHS